MGWGRAKVAESASPSMLGLCLSGASQSAEISRLFAVVQRSALGLALSTAKAVLVLAPLAGPAFQQGHRGARLARKPPPVDTDLLGRWAGQPSEAVCMCRGSAHGDCMVLQTCSCVRMRHHESRCNNRIARYRHPSDP